MKFVLILIALGACATRPNPYTGLTTDQRLKLYELQLRQHEINQRQMQQNNVMIQQGLEQMRNPWGTPQPASNGVKHTTCQQVGNQLICDERPE